MKRNRINRDRRLLEALDYLDEAYIADVVDNLKLPPVPGVPLPRKGRILRSLKPVALLVACTLLLAAFIPAVTYLTSRIPDIVAFFRGDQTEVTLPEDTYPDDPPETTEAVKHEHNGTEGLIYRINDDGASVTLISIGSCEAKDITVASVYDGLPVVAITDGALAYGKFRTVTIPEGVTSIGVGAFKNCTEAVSISIPDSVTDIGANALEGCIALRSIGIPSGITVLPSGMFANCEKLARVRIQPTVKRIVMGAFTGCQKLTSIEFNGTKVEWDRIQKGDFWHMQSAIKQIDCNNGSLYVQPSPTDPPTHNGSEGLEYRLSGVEAILASIGTCTEKNIVIASTYMGYPVKWINANCFANSDIESVSIPETIVSIGDSAFANCTKLTSISLGASIRTIYSNSFFGCTALQSIEIDADNTYLEAVDGCVIDKTANRLVFVTNNARIPEGRGITVIAQNAFHGLSGVTEIAIPEGVVTIPASAINDCRNLRKISLPSTLKSLDVNFITGREQITTVLFPNGHATYTAEGNGIIDKSSKTLVRGFAATRIPDWVTVIGADAFNGCVGLVTVKLPESLKTIKTGAFRDCTSLQKISVTGNVTLMATAFYGCTSLSEVELGNEVQLSGTQIFANCTALTSVTIPERVTSVPDRLFMGCSKLSKIVLHPYVKELATYAFAECPALTSINIPTSIRELPDYLFYGSLNLHEIIYEGTRHEWYTVKKGYSWKGGTLTLVTVRCSDGDLSLTEAQPQAGSYGLLYRVNADGQSAELIGFKDGALNSFEIATTYNGVPVTGIAEGAFRKLSSTGTITLGSYITKLESKTFEQSPFVSGMVITTNLKKIEDGAFLGCIGLKEITYRGTANAWNQIEKGENWNYGSAIEVVHCLNGDVRVTPNCGTQNGSAGLTYAVRQDEFGEFYAVFTGIGTCTDTDIVVASDYCGYPVRALQNQIFRGNANVKSVTLPEDVTVIPASFFYEATSLERVTIPESVTALENHSFFGCTALKEITLPAGLESIGNYVFAKCTSLSSIALPESLTSIGYACLSQTQIDSVHIPKNVTLIGNAYFGENIKNITIDPENPVFVITGNCLIDRERKVLLRILGEPEFPQDGSIRYIYDDAFEGVDLKINKLILPEGLEQISWYSAKWFGNVEELHIPSTFVDWSAGLFADFTSLKKITVAEGNPKYYSVDNCVIERETGKLVLGCNTSVIPTDGSIKSIGRYAFYGCKSLESITIPEGVTEIGYYAFCSCISLREVKLPESLVMINDAAFAYCIALTEITLPENLKFHSLALWLFEGCSSLEKIYIPRTIEYIDGFYGCTSLREIVYGGTVEEWNRIGFYGDIFRDSPLEKIICTDGVITVSE